MIGKLSHFLFCLVLLSGLALSVQAQKPQIKAITHQHYSTNDAGELILSAKNKKEYNDFNKLELEESYKLNKANVMELDKQQRYTYDPKGRHQNTLEFNKDGVLEAETKLYWDSYNNKSKVENIAYNNGQQVSVATTYLLLYDDNGNKQEEKFFDQEGHQTQGRTWFYNNQNELSKSYTWMEQKKAPKKEIYTSYKRDKNGNLTQSITSEKVNGKEFRKDIRYFSNNYVIEWKTFIGGKLESHFFNEYRDSVIIRTTRQNKRKVISLEEAEKEKVRLQKRIAKNSTKKAAAENDIFVTNTEYDAYGNILVTTQSVNDKVTLVTQYSYDDYGNQIKMLKVNKETNTTEEELLSYDNWGNIASKVLKKNDKVMKKDLYQYEYFPR